MTLPRDTTEPARWRRRFALALAGLLLFVGFTAAAQRRADDALRRAEAAVEAQGSSLDPRQIAPAAPIDGENAHHALEAARRLMKSADKELYREVHRRLRREIHVHGARTTEEDVQLFRRALEQYGPVLEVLDSARSIETARLELDPDLPTFRQLPFLNAIEHFADLLAMRSRVAVAEGRPADAWRDVRAIFRLAAWASEEMPTLVSQLMAVTVVEVATLETQTLLHETEPDTTEMAAVLAEARRLDLPAGFDVALEMDRAEMFTWLQDPEIGPDQIRTWFPESRWWPSTYSRPWSTMDFARYAGAMTAFSADCRRPGFDRPAVFGHPERFEAHYPAPAWAPLTRRLVNENVVDACNKRDHTLALIDLMELAFRVEELRRSSDSPLGPEELGVLPIDPFSGAPYVFRETASGAVLTSFGPDRDDDGGEPHPTLGTGWNRYEGDLVWFLDPRSP